MTFISIFFTLQKYSFHSFCNLLVMNAEELDKELRVLNKLKSDQLLTEVQFEEAKQKALNTYRMNAGKFL